MLWHTDSTCHQRAMSLLDFSCVGAPKFEAALGRSRSRYSVNFLRSCNLAQPRSSFGNVNQSFRAFLVLPSWLDALLDARIAFAYTPELDALVGEELACFRSRGDISLIGPSHALGSQPLNFSSFLMPGHDFSHRARVCHILSVLQRSK